MYAANLAAELRIPVP